MDDVDYLVVGGGTAGCILASRLTASGRHRVLLVEAGGEPRSLFIRVPAGFGHLLRSRRYNWGYESAPDPDTDGRAIPVPSGRGLGGSGLINGVVYVRGQAADFDGWAAAGATGCAHADVEPYFRRLEDYAQGGRGQGREGPLHVTQVRERFPVADAFYQLRGRRWSPYDAYLASARGRSNLSVMSHTHALGLTFDGHRCTGVRVGVPVRHDLVGVGENYSDHYALRMNWRLQGIHSLNESTRGWRLAAAAAQYAVRRTGVLTLGPALRHGFVSTDPGGDRPDTQFLFMHASYENAARRVLDRQPGMTIGIIQQRPRSVGAIHSVSADPVQPPAIHPRFLSAPEDRRHLIAAIRLARRLVGRPSLAPLIAREMNPGPLAGDDDALLRWARATGQTLYHPCGTCRMGGDEGAVVDPRLRVRGVEGLRVADASVMPSITSGNIHAPVMMIAERASDMILADA